MVDNFIVIFGIAILILLAYFYQDKYFKKCKGDGINTFTRTLFAFLMLIAILLMFIVIFALFKFIINL